MAHVSAHTSPTLPPQILRTSQRTDSAHQNATVQAPCSAHRGWLATLVSSCSCKDSGRAAIPRRTVGVVAAETNHSISQRPAVDQEFALLLLNTAEDADRGSMARIMARIMTRQEFNTPTRCWPRARCLARTIRSRSVTTNFNLSRGGHQVRTDPKISDGESGLFATCVQLVSFLPRAGAPPAAGAMQLPIVTGLMQPPEKNWGDEWNQKHKNYQSVEKFLTGCQELYILRRFRGYLLNKYRPLALYKITINATQDGQALSTCIGPLPRGTPSRKLRGPLPAIPVSSFSCVVQPNYIVPLVSTHLYRTPLVSTHLYSSL